MRWSSLVWATAFTVTIGCTSTVREPGPATAALKNLKTEPVAMPPPPPSAAVLQALTPSLQDARTEPHFDLNVVDADARSFFMGLISGTDYNMVVHPDVSGKISLSLRNVTVAEVMDIARDVYGYEFVRKGLLFTVSGSGLQTSVIPINYLNLKRAGISETRVSSGQGAQSGQNNGQQNSGSGIGNSSNGNGNNSSSGNSQTTGTRIETTSEADLWKDLEATLRTLISASANGQVVVNAQAGLVVVRATPNDMRNVRDYLQATQLSLNRQVILEAKIVEVVLSDGFQAGINWSNVANVHGGDILTTGQQGQTILQATSLAPINGVFTGVFNGGDFQATLNLLKTQGDVQVLSSPRVSTVNNQKAVIKVGTDEFFVTDVSSTTVASGAGSTSTPQVHLSPFFSGIALDVTPQISEGGDIVLHMHPSVTDVKDQTKSIKVFNSDFTLPLALSSVRESDAIVRARSGQIVVIGGLMQDKRTTEESGIPWLSDIPWLGGLFRQTRNGTAKSELVILLRAVIADDANQREQIDSTQQRIEALSGRSSSSPTP